MCSRLNKYGVELRKSILIKKAFLGAILCIGSFSSAFAAEVFMTEKVFCVNARSSGVAACFTEVSNVTAPYGIDKSYRQHQWFG